MCSGRVKFGVFSCDCPLRVYECRAVLTAFMRLAYNGGTFPEGPLKDNPVIPEKNMLRDELFSFTELLNIIKEINSKRTLIVHMEEEWGKSFDDYKKLEKEYGRYLQFAYDGMKVEL